MILLLNAKGPKLLEASNLKMDDKQVPGIYTYIIHVSGNFVRKVVWFLMYILYCRVQSEPTKTYRYYVIYKLDNVVFSQNTV